MTAPAAATTAAVSSAIETAMQSRLYYLGIAGLVVALAATLAPIWAALALRWRASVFAPVALAAIVVGWVSHQSADAFAQRSVEIAAVAPAARTRPRLSTRASSRAVIATKSSLTPPR